MALLLVHPDYVSFGGGEGILEYPSDYYRTFLEHVKERYEGQYWNALPCEVADFWAKRQSIPASSNRLARTQFNRSLVTTCGPQARPAFISSDSDTPEASAIRFVFACFRTASMTVTLVSVDMRRPLPGGVTMWT